MHSSTIGIRRALSTSMIASPGRTRIDGMFTASPLNSTCL